MCAGRVPLRRDLIFKDRFPLSRAAHGGAGATTYSVDILFGGLELYLTGSGHYFSTKRKIDTSLFGFFGESPGTVAGPLFPPRPPTPGGIGNREFGKIMKWSTGNESARQRMASLTRGELERAGVTKEMAAQWRDFYREVQRVSPQNPSAAGRADLMQRAFELLNR